jgi:hypothetical protein
VVALGDDELVHVLLPLDVGRTQTPQIFLPDGLLPAVEFKVYLRPVYTNNVFRLSDATAASDTAQK